MFKQRTIGLRNYIVIFSFLNLILYHSPLFEYALRHLDYANFWGKVTVLSLVFAQFFGNVMILSLLSIINTNFIRVLTPIFFIGNSIALYFMQTYNIMLDKTMIGNVFNTNLQEVTELYNPKIFLYILFLGILPSFFMYNFKIYPTKIWKKLTIFISSLVFVLLWAYLNSSTWLWFDKHAKHIGSYTLPWSYVVNPIRYYKNKMPKAKPKLLSDLKFQNIDDTLVVLVIGESARSANFSLYGYEKPSNKLLEKQDIAVFPNTSSCTTYTTASIKCILSHQGSNYGFTEYENLPSYLKRFGISVLWRSANWGEPNMSVTLFQKGGDIKSLCKSNCKNLGYDEVLLYKLDEQIKSLKSKHNFVVLHQSGSHGPLYSKKYPKEFEKFSPTCKSVELQKCSQEELVNAYDNTIVYNDYFLNTLIEILKKQEKRVVMLFISDHGESLGESGFYLHGTPKSIAPKYQSDIPFLVWMNERFKKDMELKDMKNSYSQDYIFHSILGAFNAKSKEYEPSLDIFRSKP